MKKKATLMVLLLLVFCQVALASDAAKLTLPSGTNNPMTIRYPELANAPAPAVIEVHDRDKLARAALLKSRLIGVDNRNLRTLTCRWTSPAIWRNKLPNSAVDRGRSRPNSPRIWPIWPAMARAVS